MASPASRSPLATLRRKLDRAWRRHVLRDPVLRAAKQFKRDGGEHGLRLDYPLGPDSLVVDVGGYLGDFAAEMLQRHGCRVALFEPVPAFAAHCQARFAHEPRVQCHAYALGAADARLRIQLDADASSLIPGALPAAGAAPAEQEVLVRDAHQALTELGITRIDLLKLNIEGAEYALLERLIAQGWLPRIGHLQVQFHDFVPDAVAQRNRIRQQLAATHEEAWCYPFVWESWRPRGAPRA